MAESHLFAKVVLSGSRVELYYYSSPIVCGKARSFDLVRSDGTTVTSSSKREDNLYRARQTVRRLIWSNLVPHTKFITLTYAQCCLDYNKVISDLKAFVLSLKRSGFVFPYLYVLEHQLKRGLKEGNEGSLHIHLLAFETKKIPLDVLNKAWKHGSTDISSLRNVKDVGAYVSKYISKETIDILGKHSYGVSRGLKRPLTQNFYIEGFSDGFLDIQNEGLHPDHILEKLQVSFSSSIRHDYRDDHGVGCDQTVKYYQGVFNHE